MTLEDGINRPRQTEAVPAASKLLDMGQKMQVTSHPINMESGAGAAPGLPARELNLAAKLMDASLVPPVTRELVEHQLEEANRQLDALRSELNDLRRRDDTLNFCMQRLDEELRLAARLQQDFLPRELPQIGKVQFHSLFRPAGYVSGDLYDVMRLDEKHVGFYVADAVGHGVPAALLAMFLKHALQTKQTHARGYTLLDPGEALRRLNCAFVEQNLTQSTFATAVYGMINTETLELRFARAGHPCPILMRADGAVEDLDSHGSLLGVFPDETFDVYTTQLAPGDRLLIYTDGIEVVFWDDQTSQQPSQLHRWRGELLARRHMTAEALLVEFDEHLDQESGSLQARDDLTMLLIDVEH